jgi:hypothetical protein
VVGEFVIVLTVRLEQFGARRKRGSLVGVFDLLCVPPPTQAVTPPNIVAIDKPHDKVITHAPDGATYFFGEAVNYKGTIKGLESNSDLWMLM